MDNSNFEEMSMQDMLNELNSSMKRINEGEILKGKIISILKDALIVNINFMSDGIVPKEEVSYEEIIDLKEHFNEGDEIFVTVLKVNDGEGNVLLSKKQADGFKVWDELEDYFISDKIFEIIVKDVVKGGAVTDIKGARAFIPASKLSSKYVDNLEEFKGKTLKVKIIEFDKNDKKVVLSAKEIIKNEEKAVKEDMWSNINRKYKIGDVVDGTIVRIMNYGAFVELERGIDGLVHISEISEERIMKPSDVLAIDTKVKVKILDIKAKDKRISLSIKEAIDKPKEDFSAFVDDYDTSNNLGDLFKDKFKDFKF